MIEIWLCTLLLRATFTNQSQQLNSPKGRKRIWLGSDIIVEQQPVTRCSVFIFSVVLKCKQGGGVQATLIIQKYSQK